MDTFVPSHDSKDDERLQNMDWDLWGMWGPPTLRWGNDDWAYSPDEYGLARAAEDIGARAAILFALTHRDLCYALDEVVIW